MTKELGKVFVVDDEVELMTALCDMLGEQGYVTTGFTSGKDALKELAGQEVDILLSDIMMPGISGIDLLKSALEIDSNLIGIMMTGHGTIQTAVEAMKAGAFDYVLKPFRLAELMPIFTRALEVRRLRLENVQLRESVAIYELTQALSFGLDVNTIQQKMAEAAIRQCGADESSIMLLSEDGNYLQVTAIAGKDRSTVLGERIEMGKGIAGWVALNREPLLLKDNVLEAEFSPVNPRSDIRSSIVVPLVAAGTLVGVLNVNDTHSTKPLTLGKLKALSILGGIGAHALESAKLFTKVKQAEEKHRSLLEQLPAIVHLTRRDNLRCLYINPFIKPLLGYTPEEWISGSPEWINQIHPDDREQLKKRMENCLAEGETMVFEYRIMSKNGETVWMRDQMKAVQDPDGGPPLLRGIAVNITDRKLAEEKLKTSEEMNRLLIEESPVGIGVFLDGKLAYANPALSRIFGYDVGQDSIIGLTADELLAPEYREVARERQAARFRNESVPARIEYRGVRKSGELFDLEVWPKGINYAGKPALLNFILDTTESKALRTQLLQSQKMEAVGTLAGGVAHDFNNILTIIAGFSQLLLSEKGSDDPEYADLEKVVIAASRGAELVKRLLTFSKKAETNLTPLNLNKEIEEMKKLLIRTIPKMIQINLHLDPDLPRVNADSTQIGQLLMNLALNAKDAMPDGGEISIETKNVVLDEEFCRTHVEFRPGNYVVISVSDTGEGMDSATVHRIFEPFFTTKELGKGTGLGLSTVYGIVKQHDGFIGCYSEPGYGTTFRIYLPPYWEKEEEETAAAERPMPKGGTETLLVVDDETVILELGRRILTNAGYTVLSASGGKDALKLYQERSENISLVILDLIMPGMGGKQCLEELLKINPDIKVIVSSGYSVEGRTRKMIDNGAKGFVTKPFTAMELLGTIRSVLDEDESEMH